MALASMARPVVRQARRVAMGAARVDRNVVAIRAARLDRFASMAQRAARLIKCVVVSVVHLDRFARVARVLHLYVQTETALAVPHFSPHSAIQLCSASAIKRPIATVAAD